ncbi:hypothetical protein psal_cds_115 [Pandoravirus salinus]|uniref:Uncharacterized protein n=1 Tax=Pandoravirus salinus TaxID=1349410 RepID=S4W0F8_9VIRU|nr:hypothetical protein psal_cds_115 [Pandoravirus salinus]AGO83560.1 hypothetical protein psal_cds_115 [Pandoravirus salinus]
MSFFAPRSSTCLEDKDDKDFLLLRAADLFPFPKRSTASFCRRHVRLGEHMTTASPWRPIAHCRRATAWALFVFPHFCDAGLLATAGAAAPQIKQTGYGVRDDRRPAGPTENEPPGLQAARSVTGIGPADAIF